jgi:hypothetical protein
MTAIALNMAYIDDQFVQNLKFTPGISNQLYQAQEAMATQSATTGFF